MMAGLCSGGREQLLSIGNKTRNKTHHMRVDLVDLLKARPLDQSRAEFFLSNQNNPIFTGDAKPGASELTCIDSILYLVDSTLRRVGVHIAVIG